MMSAIAIFRQLYESLCRIDHLSSVRWCIIGNQRAENPMTPELQRALRRHTQWFGPYKASGELKKIPCGYM